MTLNLGPVSYTHLDVYKRQLMEYYTTVNRVGYNGKLCAH